MINVIMGYACNSVEGQKKKQKTLKEVRGDSTEEVTLAVCLKGWVYSPREETFVSGDFLETRVLCI